MLRLDVNKFHLSRKPIVLKPLPQFDQGQPPPGDQSFSKASIAYSSVYGSTDDTEELIMQHSSAVKIEHKNSTNRLPRKEFSLQNRSGEYVSNFLLPYLLIGFFSCSFALAERWDICRRIRQLSILNVLVSNLSCD